MTQAPTKVLCVPAAPENPYQARLAGALAPLGFDLRTRPLGWRIERELAAGEALLHLHWLAPLLSDSRQARTALRLALFARSLSRLRKRGVPLVWTVHNLYQHERRHPALERRLRRWLGRHSAALIVHGEAAATSVRAEYDVPGSVEIAVVPHGHYMDCYPGSHEKAESRRRLGLDPEAPTLLFLGQVRAYKGVVALLEAVGRVGSDLQLIIAGRPNPTALGDELRARARNKAGIHLRLDYVSDHDVPDLLAACDVFVLPHEQVLTSGSAVLAMSFSRPCLAPRNGCFEELLGEEGCFFYDPREERGLDSGIKAALAARGEWNAMGLRNRTAIQAHDWNRVARDTAAVYARALGSDPARPCSSPAP